jgi:hypothetical protein
LHHLHFSLFRFADLDCELSTRADALLTVVETWHALRDACLPNKINNTSLSWIQMLMLLQRIGPLLATNGVCCVIFFLPNGFCQQNRFCFLTINRVLQWLSTNRVQFFSYLTFQIEEHLQFIH